LIRFVLPIRNPTEVPVRLSSRCQIKREWLQSASAKLYRSLNYRGIDSRKLGYCLSSFSRLHQRFMRGGVIRVSCSSQENSCSQETSSKIEWFWERMKTHVTRYVWVSRGSCDVRNFSHPCVNSYFTICIFQFVYHNLYNTIRTKRFCITQFVKHNLYNPNCIAWICTSTGGYVSLSDGYSYSMGQPARPTK